MTTTMTEDELADLEEEIIQLHDRYFWFNVGSDQLRKEIDWKDSDDKRLEYLQQLLYG